MSCFIIDTDTMDKCVRAICASNQSDQMVRSFLSIDTKGQDAPGRIGRLLFTLNTDSFAQCYEGRHAEDIDEGLRRAKDYAPNVRPGFKPSMRDLAGMIKALQCLAYQSSEGDCDTNHTYRELERVTGLLAIEAVEMMPAYKAAAW